MTAFSPDEPPESPSRRCSRTLKCESIRSLRGLLQASLSSVSLVGGEDEKRQLLLEEAASHDDSSEDRAGDEATLLLEVNVNEAESIKKKPMAVKSASVTATKVQLSRRAADEMRFRLLQNLGIDKQKQQQQQQQLQQQVSVNSNAVIGTPLPSSSGNNSEPWGPSYTVSLNDASCAGDTSSAASTASTTTESASAVKTADNVNSSVGNINNNNNNDPPLTTKLRFLPTVTVHPIPSCKVYSSRIRDTIWTGSYELHENVARNSLEFSYEDWDPNHVLDEDTGLIYVHHHAGKSNNNNNNTNRGGEWVHPVHYGAPARDMGTPLASDAIWEYTCQQKLGIPTAESFHSLPSITKN